MIRRRRRLIAAAALAALGPLPLLAVGAAGCYMHSPLYRTTVESHVSEFFQLPTRIGRVVPVGWDQQQVYDTEVFLPDADGKPRTDGRVAYARQATWQRSEREGLFDLTIYGGELDLTPARWSAGDFKRLERSLVHDYYRSRLHKAYILNGSLRWGRGDFRIDLDGIEGEVTFVNGPAKRQGHAELGAARLNRMPAHVRARAVFDAGGGTGLANANGLLRWFELTVGNDEPIPVEQLHLDRLFNCRLTAGRFTGTLTYRPPRPDQAEEFAVVNAHVRGLDLAQLSSCLPSGPVAGKVDLHLDEFRAGPSHVNRLAFSGEASGLDMAAAMAALGLEPLQGTASLEVVKADLSPGPIEDLILTGQVDDIDLARVSRLWASQFGAGKLHGTGKVKLIELTVQGGMLRAFRAELTNGSPGDHHIDGALVEAIVARAAGFKLPVALPEKVAYRNLGVAVESTDEGIRLVGIGGSDGKSLMTLDVPLPSIGPVNMGLAGIDIPAPAQPIKIERLSKVFNMPLLPIDVVRLHRVVQR